MFRRVVACIFLAALAGCDATERIAQQTFVPAVDGQLTVATALPAPGFWEGADEGQPTGGFEWAIATELAARFDLELALVDVPLDRIVQGDLGGADLALSQLAVTDERRGVLEFSVPYYRDDAGVLVRAGDELDDGLHDLKAAREAAWVVVRGTVHEEFVQDVIRPDAEPLLVADDVAAASAVSTGAADAALLDLASALVLDDDSSALVTTARFDVDQQIAVALASDSPNVEPVDAALRALEREGALAALEREWLVPRFGVDPDSIPAIRFR